MRKKGNPLIDGWHYLQSLMPKRGGQKDSVQNDMRRYSFAGDQGVVAHKKRLAFSFWRKRWQQKRQAEQEGYRQAPPRQLSGLRPLLILAIGVVSVLVFTLVGGATHLAGLLHGITFLQVHSLVVDGNKAISRARLRELSGIVEYKTSLIGMDVTAIKARIEADPWVSEAQVSRNWPSTVTIEIVEHRPVAMVNSGGANDSQLYYTDAGGVSFLPVMVGKDLDFPVITGLDSITAQREKEAVFADIMIFLKRTERNDPNLPAQSVSEIHVTPKGEMIVYLVDHPFPIYFGKGETAVKYSRLVKVLESLYQKSEGGVKISQVDYIRMDYLEDKVLVAQSKSG